MQKKNIKKTQRQQVISLEDERKMSADEWVAMPENHNRLWRFPTQEHLETYLSNIETRSYDEIRLLLQKLVIPNCSLGSDNIYAENHLKHSTDDKSQYHRRIVRFLVSGGQVLPWEGLTWIIDLLPWWPQIAIDVLDAYMLSLGSAMPDELIYALSDARSVIRARYITTGVPDGEAALNALKSINSRDFEYLVERLYDKMGYSTILTPASNDGGKDIICTRNQKGAREKVYVECKKWTNQIGVEIVRQLMGVVLPTQAANKGVIVTTSGFTRNAYKLQEDHVTIELIDIADFIELMNKHLGHGWPRRVDTLIRDSRATNG